jgi:hypothetical protein
MGLANGAAKTWCQLIQSLIKCVDLFNALHDYEAILGIIGVKKSQFSTVVEGKYLSLITILQMFVEVRAL